MRTPIRFYLVVAAVFATAFGLVFLSAGAESNTDPKEPKSPGDISTNRLIVKYKEEADQAGKASPSSEGRIRALSNAAGMEIRYSRAMSGNAHVLELTSRVPRSNVEEIAARIAALPDVEYAEPDYILFPSLTPNDSFYASQWHYFDTYGINLPAAWDITTGSSSIRIAVIDTGIVNHVDLSGRWVGGYDFISDALIANDGNGRDSSPLDPGDWITSAEESAGYFEGCPAEDSSWHGTHVAGTIGAASNNGTGVAGINWNSPIVPIRVLGKCGGYMSDIVDGMRWAAGLSVSGIPVNTNPAKVLNLSLGGSGSCGTTLQTAINDIRTAGSSIIVAAGNSSLNLNSNNYIPANCSGVITVAATDRGGDRAYYSNYGLTVEISAPGGEGSNGVYSTLNNGATTPASDSYVYYSGTSMATPHVAGVVSLMYSIDPTLTPDEVLQILQSTARAFPGGSGCTSTTCGSGIVNAADALNAVMAMQLPDLIVTNVTLNPGLPIPNTPFDVVITIKNQGGSTGPVDVYRDVYIGTDPLTTIDPLTGCPAAGDYFRFDSFTDLAPGQTDTKTVTVTDGLEKGDYQLWVYVDSRCLIHESGEVNNTP
jgi:serine protease